MTVALETGQVLAGRYRLERKLGEGGMGVVWAAVNTVTLRPVALKLLKRTGPDDSVSRERFVREARAANVVNHPAVVAVHDVLQLEDGSLCMVMDLLRGESLAERLARSRKGALQLDEVASIMTRVCGALAAAHREGVVHRDLKPDNIFLAVDPDGTTSVKVLDFGIAKLTGAEPDGSTSAVTQTGALLGTPFYMSPEQLLADKAVDHRADLWAVGVILYEALSGARPTQADSLGQIVKLVVTSALVPLWQREPTLPQAVLDLVARLLRYDRNERPNDMEEVVAVLAPFAQGSIAPAPLLSLPPKDASRVAFAPTVGLPAVSAVTPPKRGSAWRRIGLGGLRWGLRGGLGVVALVALIVAAVGLRKLRRHPRSPTAIAATTLVERRLTTLPPENYLHEVKLTPDASQLVFTDNDGFWVQPTSGGSRRALGLPPREPGDAYAGLSLLPDGQSALASVRRGARILSYVAPLDGGPARLHRDGPGTWAVASPDGKRLVVGLVDKWRMGPFEEGASGLTVVLPLPLDATWAFSPDSRSIVSWADGDPPSLSITSVDGGSRERIFTDPSLKSGASLPGLAWPEPGRLVFSARQGDLSIVRELSLDAAGRVTSGPRDLWTTSLGAIDALDVAAGRISVLIGAATHDIFVADLSSDARHLVGAPHRITSSEGRVGWPGWLPDGRVSYVSNRDSQVALYARDARASGSGEPTLLIPPPVVFAPYAPLRTGELLFARPGGDAGRRSVVMDRPGKPEREVSTYVDHDPTDWKAFVVRCGAENPGRCVLGTWRDGVMTLAHIDLVTGLVDPPFFAGSRLVRFAVSPDGATVAATDESALLTLIATAGGASHSTSVVPSGSTLQYCDFTPDGRTLIIGGLDFSAGDYGLISVGLDGRGTMLRSTKSQWMHHIAVSPDGHKVAFTQRTYDTDVWLLEPH